MQYDISTLADAVEQVILLNLEDNCRLSVRHAVPVYDDILDHQVNKRDRMAHVVDMIARNFEMVMDSEAECKLLRQRPHLMAAVLRRVRGSDVPVKKARVSKKRRSDD